MINQFIDLLRAWLGLSIGTVKQLVAVSGFSRSRIYEYRRGRMYINEFVADVLLTSMGVIEQRYIEQWRAK